MHKYMIFIGKNTSKIIRKETATTEFIKKMKQQGFRKHHIEIEAENEKEAAVKFNNFNCGYLDTLREYSVSFAISAAVVILMALIYIIRTW
ncbi:hypothetical protein [Pantoea brenneri]|uniref:hypothetical protein n=1 Tax=Pantoea brenneri TaxID=472694 RepID=UPI00289D081C|nr:hypothetical protein [Pantoea brenneri]